MDPSERARPSRLPGGTLRLRVDAEAAALAGEVARLAARRGLAPEPVALDRLHESLDPGRTRLDEHGMNAVTRSFYRTGAPFLAAYHRLVRRLAGALPFDFAFQAEPLLRFHFPVPWPPELRTRRGTPFRLHSDTLGGHPYRMLNAWLPLTRAAGSAALRLAPLAASLAALARFHDAPGVAAIDPHARLAPFYEWIDERPDEEERVRGACLPVPLEPGDLLLFDARCLHGGDENREPATRVSLDFRILALDDCEALERDGGHGAGRFVRGLLLDRRTAREL